MDTVESTTETALRKVRRGQRVLIGRTTGTVLWNAPGDLRIDCGNGRDLSVRDRATITVLR